MLSLRRALPTLAVLFLCASAQADIIYSVTPATGSSDSPFFLGPDVFDQSVMFSWTMTAAYNNVALLAEIGGDGSPAITGFLTNEIGPGTTVANQIATATVVPSSSDTTVSFFPSGINLGPGTYYFVLAGTATGLSDQEVHAFDPVTVTQAPTVTIWASGIVNSNGAGLPNDTYTPASVFDTSNDALNPPYLSIQITGTPAASTPEPGTAGEFLAGFVLGGYFLCSRSLMRTRLPKPGLREPGFWN
jgi:hypothetical protein